MTNTIARAASALLLLTACGGATDASTRHGTADSPASAVRLSFLRAPSPLPMNGRVHLAWALLIQNVGEDPVDVRAIVVGEERHEGASLAARMKWLSDVDAESAKPSSSAISLTLRPPCASRRLTSARSVA